MQVLDHKRHNTPPSLRRVDGCDHFASQFSSLDCRFDLPFEGAGREDGERIMDVVPCF
jgi:hypothetical protein